MAQIRNMLRAPLYDQRTPPGAALAHLDRTLQTEAPEPVRTQLSTRM
ncbi:hypothetical protein [Streptomyces sp. BP-8]|uniref:Uncharacterized protein n=1 Tax=Streptomyces sirii TaxID=3127701 RepID=A0ABZ2QFB8_9ACTN